MRILKGVSQVLTVLLVLDVAEKLGVPIISRKLAEGVGDWKGRGRHCLLS